VSKVAATIFDLLVWEEGKDEPIDVRADQRDMAAFEVEFKMGMARAMEEMQVNFFRFIAWHALRRTGRLEKGTKRLDWDAKVIEVEPKPDAEETVDPGSPAASEETSSTSR
jgi:hypothetical protein